MKIGRNDPCHCGSGNKYKKCCVAKDEAAEREARQAMSAPPAVTTADPVPTKLEPSTPPLPKLKPSFRGGGAPKAKVKPVVAHTGLHRKAT